MGNTPYVKPEQPGTLNISTATAHHKVVGLWEEHNEKPYIFYETANIENILKSKILKAIDSVYLRSLINKDSNKINATIVDCLKHLFEKFGQIDYTNIETLEKKLRDFSFHINDPPYVFYDIIEDLITVSEDAIIPKVNVQLVSYGLKLICIIGDFENGLLTWYSRPQSDHTWTNVKTHCSQANENLIKVRGDSIHNYNLSPS